MFNTLSINPAYAGSKGVMNATALMRAQWLGIDGAPRTQTVFVHSPLPKENMGLGLSLVNDKIGPLKQTLLYADYSYTVKITDVSKLAFGLKAGFNFLKADLTTLELNDMNDQAFSQNIDGAMKPNFGFGTYYYTDKWFVGASTPKLIENKIENGADESESKEQRHYFIIAGYVYEISEDVKFKPTILTKMTANAPVSLDVSANFLFYNMFWAGVSHRWKESASMLLQYQITDQLSAGYAYDFNLSKLAKYNSGSHEFMVSYDFLFNKTKIKSPRYF